MNRNIPSEIHHLSQKPWRSANGWHTQAAIWGISYCLGVSCAVAIAYRLPFFYKLSPLLRFGLIVLGGLAPLLLLRVLLQMVLQLFAVSPKWKRIVWLIVAVLVGCLIAASIHLPVSPLITQHRFALEALPAQNGLVPITVEILEVCGPDQRALPPDQFFLTGDWQIVGQGIRVESKNRAKLTYSFAAPDGNLDVLLVKNSQGGQIQVTADGATRQVNLFASENDQFHLTLPISGKGRQALLLKFADVVALAGLISLALFAVPFYISPSLTHQHTVIRINIFSAGILGCLYRPAFAASPEFRRKFGYTG